MLRSQKHSPTNSSTSTNTAPLPATTFVHPEDHDYFELSEYIREVTNYIGGYIVPKTSANLNCAECADLLVSENVHILLISLKDNGGLIEPSEYVKAAMHDAERIVRQSRESQRGQVNLLTQRAFQEFVSRHDSLLKDMPHYRQHPEHVLNLQKCCLRNMSCSGSGPLLGALQRRVTNLCPAYADKTSAVCTPIGTLKEHDTLWPGPICATF